MYFAEFAFGVVALIGLFAAKRPDIFVHYCLAKWQRSRIGGNWAALSWTGWILFIFANCVFAGMLIADALQR